MERTSKAKLAPTGVGTKNAAILASGERSEGLEALVERGAEPWPDPKAPDEMRSVMSGGAGMPLTAPELVQHELFGTGAVSALGLRNLGNLRERYLEPCLRADWIEMTIPDKPRRRNQRFRLTAAGRRLVEGLDD